MRSSFNRTIARNFLSAIRGQLLVFFGMLFIFGLVYVLGKLPIGLFLYSVELSAFLFGIYLIIRYIQYAERYKTIEAFHTADLSRVVELSEAVHSTDRLYLQKIAFLLEELKEKEQTHLVRQADQLDYFTLWLHQIKTPISAISLLTQSSMAKEAKQISQELLRLEDYTHMALNYVKLEETGAEMDLALVDLDEVIKRAVKKYSILFIYNGIKLNYEPLQLKVLSDGKWLQNLIEQILSNSLKYTASGSISIYVDPSHPQTLLIEDTGIGIRPEDLPKVFKKGYSGFNGRLHEKSTGLGLFLGQKIAERLGHTLSIQSELGKGTRVAIQMAREEYTDFD